MGEKKTVRWLWWAVLGSVAVVAAVNLSGEERDAGPEGSKLAARDIPVRGKDLGIAESLALAPERMRRGRQFGEVTGEPFAGQEPVRPAAPAVAAPPVVVPAFPYRFGGQLKVKGGETHVYLSLNGQLIPLREGEALDGGFKVMSVGVESVEVLHELSGRSLQILYSSLADASPAPVMADSRPPDQSADPVELQTPAAAGSGSRLLRRLGRRPAPLSPLPGDG